MNLLLLTPEDMTGPDTAVITGRRFLHADEVLKLSERTGVCRAGLLDGMIGRGVVESVDRGQGRMTLRFCPESPPPPPLPLVLAAALPRPKTLRKVIHAAVSMGVKEIWFFQSWKTDKSYWNSPFLEEEALRGQVLLALEQAVDTVMPAIRFHRRFQWFVQDVLPERVRSTGGRLMAAHPGPGTVPCPVGAACPVVLVVGPEGGFTPHEVALLKDIGAETVALGPRILRTEVAVAALISRLFP